MPRFMELAKQQPGRILNMINDVFNEQLIKKQKTSADTLKMAAIWGGAILLSAALSIFIPYIGIMLAVLVIWGAIFLTGRLKQEFEYSFTNGDLDIDVIYNRSRRKRIVTIDTKKLLGMEKVQNKEQAAKGYDKVLDLSSGALSDDLYGLVYEIDYKKTRIFIEPNESILKAIQTFAPRSVTGRYGAVRSE